MNIDLSVVLAGIEHAFTLTNLLWLLIGVCLGLIAGTLPGFSGGSMMAILMPLVVVLPVDTMLITLAAVYAANVYSDSTAGILYNIPGGAAGVPATVEGYQLKSRGRLVEAFANQVAGSFFGATFGFFFLVALVPTFLYFVQFFGSAERALLAVWALVFISSGVITRGDPVRAFISVGIGLTLGLIGQQPNIGTFRFTFGLTGLWDGLKVVLVVLALFAIPQLLEMVRNRTSFAQENERVADIPFFGLYHAVLRTFWTGRDVLVRSALFGVLIGVVPGIGTSTASWGGYSVAQSLTKHPEPFGTGNPDGVLGAECASNSCEVGTVIPLLALGIPGSAGAAIMLGALSMVGINPGPSMYASYGQQVWTIIFGIGLSGFVFTLLAYPFIRGAQWMSLLSVPFLVAAIGILCVLGSYLQSHSAFGPFVMVLMGVAAMFGGNLGLKPAAVLIGFVLGPGIEKELIRAYQIGGFERFLKPTAAIILVVVLVTLVLGIIRNVRDHRLSQAEKAEAMAEGPTEPDGVAAAKAFTFGGLALVLAAALLLTTLHYPFYASIWVWFVGIGFLILPALILIRGNLKFAGAARAWLATGPGETVDRVGMFSNVIVIAALLSYIGLITTLGFLLASGLFTLVLMLVFERGVVRPVLAAVGAMAFAWAVVTGFEIYMPRGIFNLPF